MPAIYCAYYKKEYEVLFISGLLLQLASHPSWVSVIQGQSGGNHKTTQCSVKQDRNIGFTVEMKEYEEK